MLGLALAAFFGVGGGLAGFISGGGQETHVDPEGATPAPPAMKPSHGALARLEERLRDPRVTVDGLVSTTRFSPLESAEGAPGQRPPAAHVP